eukprot:PRCOL_00006918-RA
MRASAALAAAVALALAAAARPAAAVLCQSLPVQGCEGTYASGMVCGWDEEKGRCLPVGQITTPDVVTITSAEMGSLKAENNPCSLIQTGEECAASPVGCTWERNAKECKKAKQGKKKVCAWKKKKATCVPK